MPDVTVYADPDALAQATAARLLVRIGDVLAHQPQAHVVLTGGTVGIATLAAAAASPLASGVDWTSVQVWWGDERFVPAGDADRNEGQAQQALLGSLPLPEGNIHRMPAATDVDAVQAAAATVTEQIVRAGSPEWDVLMLGLGPDGHVASLFPGHPGYAHGGPGAIPVEDSPKPPPSRVSLTLDEINRAREVWVVAAGEAKAEVVARCLHGDMELPGAAVRGTRMTRWLIDAAAATRI